MSQPTAKPCFIAGTPVSSGNVQTGEINTTTGGARSKSYLSGIGVDTLIVSGAGRLNNVVVLTQITSGHMVSFFDESVATSGAIVAGANCIYQIPPPWNVAGSGLVNPAGLAGSVTNVGMPFSSGLVVAPVGSGTCGFAFSWTPEVSTTTPNP